MSRARWFCGAHLHRAGHLLPTGDGPRRPPPHATTAPVPGLSAVGLFFFFSLLLLPVAAAHVPMANNVCPPRPTRMRAVVQSKKKKKARQPADGRVFLFFSSFTKRKRMFWKCL
ncbi:hypothetical protein [Pandoravirus japonicus]|uniref:Uncharacterized protein n=1 Tax=Pandoravirus japonicus TaxID=2823154 RepID=A0A811BRN2_9VIRU|nr:hypothetical protein [Pandoravirus japonicus]